MSFVCGPTPQERIVVCFCFVNQVHAPAVPGRAIDYLLLFWKKKRVKMKEAFSKPINSRDRHTIKKYFVHNLARYLLV